MKSRWFTVNPAKLKKFLNVMLQVPKLCVPDAMKLVNFSDKDIADLSLRRFLQRSLPGGAIKAMKVHLVGLLPSKPPPPDCHNQLQKRLVDNSIVNFNGVEHTPHWYTQSKETMVAEVRYVLLTGLHLLPISKTNKLPMRCNRREAAQKKAVKVMLLDHEVITEEAGKQDQQEYDVEDDDDNNEIKEEREEESKSSNESKE